MSDSTQYADEAPSRGRWQLCPEIQSFASIAKGIHCLCKTGDLSALSALNPVSLPDVIDRNYESDIINEKYDFIQEIIREVLVNKDRQDALTEKVDRALTHRVWGIPIFLGIMAVVFFLTFTIGDWLKGYFEMGIDTSLFERWLSRCRGKQAIAFPAGGQYCCWCRCGMFTFLPNIFILTGTGVSGGRRICELSFAYVMRCWFI